MRRSHRRHLVIVALLVILLVPAAPRFATPLSVRAAPSAKTLRVRQPFYPDVLDPQKISFVQEIDVLALAYEGLTRLDKALHTVPAAAQSWDFSPDGKTLTFHLRPGLTYSDGSPLT